MPKPKKKIGVRDRDLVITSLKRANRFLALEVTRLKEVIKRKDEQILLTNMEGFRHGRENGRLQSIVQDFSALKDDLGEAVDHLFMGAQLAFNIQDRMFQRFASLNATLEETSQEPLPANLNDEPESHELSQDPTVVREALDFNETTPTNAEHAAVNTTGFNDQRPVRAGLLSHHQPFGSSAVPADSFQLNTKPLPRRRNMTLIDDVSGLDGSAVGQTQLVTNVQNEQQRRLDEPLDELHYCPVTSQPAELQDNDRTHQDGAHPPDDQNNLQVEPVELEPVELEPVELAGSPEFSFAKVSVTRRRARTKPLPAKSSVTKRKYPKSFAIALSRENPAEVSRDRPDDEAEQPASIPSSSTPSEQQPSSTEAESVAIYAKNGTYVAPSAKVRPQTTSSAFFQPKPKTKSKLKPAVGSTSARSKKVPKTTGNDQQPDADGKKSRSSSRSRAKRTSKFPPLELVKTGEEKPAKPATAYDEEISSMSASESLLPFKDYMQKNCAKRAELVDDGLQTPTTCDAPQLMGSGKRRKTSSTVDQRPALSDHVNEVDVPSTRKKRHSTTSSSRPIRTTMTTTTTTTTSKRENAQLQKENVCSTGSQEERPLKRPRRERKQLVSSEQLFAALNSSSSMIDD